MINEKLMEIINSPGDGPVTIVSNGADGPHLANTWKSYLAITSDAKFLIPAYGLVNTEKNIENDNNVILSIANREVQGFYSKGAGFIVEGTGKFMKSGSEYNKMKAKFDGIRAVLEISITSAKQTL